MMSKTEQPKTLFQRIADHEVPADIVFEDELCVAFRDVHPKAPIHVLVVPRKPIPSMADLTDDDQELMGHLWMRIRDVAAQLGLTSGYRVVVNCGAEGGQTIDHLHFHLMGGRALGWPPG